MILEVTIDDTEYVLINIYNSNIEQHQLETLQNLSIILEHFDNFYDKNVILAGDFNIFFNKKLERKGERPFLKEQSVGHVIKLQKAFDLRDIWQIRNPQKKSLRNSFKRRYFQFILNGPFPNFFFLHKMFKLYKRSEVSGNLTIP